MNTAIDNSSLHGVDWIPLLGLGDVSTTQDVISPEYVALGMYDIKVKESLLKGNDSLQ